MKYQFENLNVWQKAKDLVKKIYLITRSFPVEEKYGVVSQMQRAVERFVE